MGLCEENKAFLKGEYNARYSLKTLASVSENILTSFLRSEYFHGIVKLVIQASNSEDRKVLPCVREFIEGRVRPYGVVCEIDGKRFGEGYDVSKYLDEIVGFNRDNKV